MEPFMHRDSVTKAIAGTTNISPDDYAEFKQGILAMSPASFRCAFLQAASLRQPQGLREVASRVLSVAGEKEPQAEPAGLMPKAECYVTPGMGHGWLAEAPGLHCRMIRAWLQDEELPEKLLRVV
jgi:hypothetical protein